jgi:hypothetical protein
MLSVTPISLRIASSTPWRARFRTLSAVMMAAWGRRA